MPMPKPNSGESQGDFLSRCMGNDMMMSDYPDHDQRVAVCMQQWDGKAASDGIGRKSFTGLELKKDKPGAFTARIATLNVVDKDGDVTLAGAFPQGKQILISSYMHRSWSGGLPVGKGVIREAGAEVFVDGEFNLNTDTGKEHYETIKFAPELQEWSYGFQVLEIDEESEWAKNPKVWRVMKRLDVFEASPVLRGAGVDTATLSIKSDKPMTFADQAEAALAAVKSLAERARLLADLRHKEGRGLSLSSKETLAALHQDMKAVQTSVEVLLAHQPEAANEGQKALLALLRTKSEIHGGLN